MLKQSIPILMLLLLALGCESSSKDLSVGDYQQELDKLMQEAGLEYRTVTFEAWDIDYDFSVAEAFELYIWDDAPSISGAVMVPLNPRFDGKDCTAVFAGDDEAALASQALCKDIVEAIDDGDQLVGTFVTCGGCGADNAIPPELEYIADAEGRVSINGIPVNECEPTTTCLACSVGLHVSTVIEGEWTAPINTYSFAYDNVCSEDL